jgi:hypothetical protein
MGQTSKSIKLCAIAWMALCIVIYGSFPSFPSTVPLIASPVSVDRSHKSDRLNGTGVIARREQQSVLTRAEKRVPLGCDRAFSVLSSSQFATLFGRCLV